MSLSAFARSILEKVFTEKGGDGKNSVQYKITISDSRIDPTVSTAIFKFKKPIPSSYIEEKMPKYVDILSDYMDRESLGIVGAVLKKYGFSTNTPYKRSFSGSGSFDYAGEEGDSEEIGFDRVNSIRLKTGRFISINNFTVLLETMMRAEMMKHMTDNGPQLHNRTGRFISSASVSSVIAGKSVISDKQIIRVSYTYMKYPYATFDPAGPNSRGLASFHRNPRKIIGEAMYRAFDALVDTTKYNLEVQLV